MVVKTSFELLLADWQVGNRGSDAGNARLTLECPALNEVRSTVPQAIPGGAGVTQPAVNFSTGFGIQPTDPRGSFPCRLIIEDLGTGQDVDSFIFILDLV